MVGNVTHPLGSRGQVTASSRLGFLTGHSGGGGRGLQLPLPVGSEDRKRGSADRPKPVSDVGSQPALLPWRNLPRAGVLPAPHPEKCQIPLEKRVGLL